jgi:hypothetical protein
MLIVEILVWECELSLLLCTGKCSEVRLYFHPSEPTPSSLGDPFLGKSRDGIGCFVYPRSENALASLRTAAET